MFYPVGFLPLQSMGLAGACGCGILIGEGFNDCKCGFLIGGGHPL